MGIDSRWVIEHPEWFLSLPEPPYPGLHVRRREPRRGRPGRDPARGPLLGQQRRGRRVRATRPLVGRAALHLPRQRRHELPVERHRPARLQPGGGPGAGDPDDRRRRAAVPGHPLRRRDGAGEEARPAAVVPGPGEGGGAIPSRAEFGTMSQAAFDAAMPRRVLARGRRPGRRRGPGHAAAGGGVLAARGLLRPDPRHAPRLQLGVHAHAPRRGQRGLPAGAQGDARVRPRDPQALRQLHEQPRREVGGRAVRQGRQVHRRGDAAGHAAGPADVRPRPVRGLRREVRDGVPAGDDGRAARRSG